MKNFQKQLNFYLQNTTLHGFAYVVSSKSWTERIFWILALCCSFVCCFFLLYELNVKINKNPIIVDRPETAIPVSNIPFPAISVCPASQQNGSTELLSLLFDVRNASHLEFIRYKCRMMWAFKDCLKDDMNWKKYEHSVQYWLGLSIEWIRKYKISSNLTLSNFGWCKTFNIIGYNEMFKENSIAEHFQSENSNDTSSKLKEMTKRPPLYTSTNQIGFRGFMIPSFQVFACSFLTGCNRDSMQLSVIVHSPYELPDIRHPRINMDVYDLLKMFIEPQIKITDGTLLNLDLKDRRCYKPNEKKLKYFKTYTLINCLRECESSFILQKCSCVPYYFIINDTSLICSLAHLECFNREYEKFEEATCKCYPPCEDIQYEFEGQRRSAQMSLFNENPHMMMKIVANFKYDSYYPQIRRKPYTMIDWLSFVGGILGLFFGFSFLSAFEVIFHVYNGFFGKNLRQASRFRSVCAMKINNCQMLKTYLRYLRMFFENSSIHGFSYIADSKMKIFERLAWLISFITSITFCIFMIRALHQKFKIDSIAIVANNDAVNVSQFPFPSLTIVQNDLTHTLFLATGHKYEDESHINVRLAITGMLSPIQRKLILQRNINLPPNYSDKIVPILYMYASSKFLESLELMWNEKFIVPMTFLLTSMGFGCSFNVAPSEDLFHQNKINKDFHYYFDNYIDGGISNYSASIPWTSSYNLDQLEMIFTSQMYSPSIFIHSPYEFPARILREDASAFEVNYGFITEVLINAEIVTIDDALKTLPLTQRMCFLDGERKLKFFKIYTQWNCELECLSEKLLETCGCVPFDVIRDNDTEICELDSYDCVDETKDSLLMYGDSSGPCNCLQPCNFVSYNFELVETKSKKSYEQAIVTVRFRDNEFVAMQRIRQFTIFDFLSYIGGLLGLFAGVSVLSFFEIFYFLTLRLICEIFRVKRGQRRIENQVCVVIAADSIK